MKFVACIVALVAFVSSAQAIETGRPAPGFSVPSKAGGTLALENYRGEVVLLDIWASWCGTCKTSFPWLNEIQQKYAGKGLKVVTVSVDENTKDAEAFVAATKANLIVGFDPQGSIPEAYEVTSMPSSFLIDRSGTVVAIHEGLSDEAKRSIEEEIVRRL